MVAAYDQGSTKRPLRRVEDVSAESEGSGDSSAQSIHGHQCSDIIRYGCPRKLHGNSSKGLNSRQNTKWFCKKSSLPNILLIVSVLLQNGKSSLGDSIYKSITDEVFDPQQFLSTLDLSSELKVVDIKNRIEASIVIWKRKMNHKDAKASWGFTVSTEKRELFEERLETILLLLKHQFPGLPQSSLDITKIQYNKVVLNIPLFFSSLFRPLQDCQTCLGLTMVFLVVLRQDVGLAILESYSRVLESLANTVMSRIEDVLYADQMAQQSVSATTSPTESNLLSAGDEPAEKLSCAANTPTSRTLLDFMGWGVEPPEAQVKQKKCCFNVEIGNEQCILQFIFICMRWRR